MMSADGQAQRPIGIFDSGLGGLTVVQAIRRDLPSEHVTYLGDTARVPYGTRSPDTVVRYARACARALPRRQIKALVVACNTVSAVALDLLSAELDVPVMGVIEPGAVAAVQAAEELGCERIGVLGTASTISSGAYPAAVARLSTRIEVICEPAPLLVPLAEEGWTDGQVPELAAERYLRPLVDANARVIVLGCTHYPLLHDVIESVARRLAGREITIVDSAKATATSLGGLLSAKGLAQSEPGPGSAELTVTDVPKSFAAVAGRFLGAEVPKVRQIDLTTA